MKKSKWIKELCWELSHCGLRVRVVAAKDCPKISVEVFCDAEAREVFSYDFFVGQGMVIAHEDMVHEKIYQEDHACLKEITRTKKEGSP